MRTSKIVGFSLPPALHKRFSEAIKRSHKTKSEFFREMMALYFKTTESLSRGDVITLAERDIANALRLYWELKSASDTTTLIVGLAIIVKDGKVLIGARKERDLNVENLSWVFPGGRMESLDFASEIKREVKEETGLDVRVKSLVAARVHPDSGFKPVQIVAMYFYCAPLPKSKEKKGKAFSETREISFALLFAPGLTLSPEPEKGIML